MNATSLPAARTRSSARFWNVFFASLAVLVAIVWFVQVYVASRDVPFWDEWSWAPLVLKAHAGTLTFDDLWAQHNEHRIFFPQILMLALDRLGFWSQRRECLVSMTIATANLWIVWRLLRKSFVPRVAYPLLALDAFLMFTPAQVENWLWGFQTAWFMVDFCVLATILVLGRPTVSLSMLAAAALFAVVASYSSAFGLALLPAVLVLLYVRRKDVVAAHYVTWVVVSAVIAFVYFHGFTPDPATPHASRLIESWQKLLHTAIVVGASLGAGGGYVCSAIFGFAGLMAGGGLFVWALRDPDRDDRVARSVWAGILAYGAAASTLIGIGRADFGPEQALASRYLTCSMTFWLGIVGLGGLFVVRNRALFRRWPVRVVAGAAAAATAACFLWTWDSYSHFFDDQRGEYAAFSNLIGRYTTASDTELARLYPDSAQVRRESSALRAIGELPEAEDARPLGRHAVGFAADGSIDDVHFDAAAHAVAATGWLIDAWQPNARDAIVVRVDGRDASHARVDYGLARPDLAVAFGVPAAGTDGFAVILATAGMHDGRHELRIGLRDDAGRTFMLRQTATFVSARGRISDIDFATHVPT